MAKTDDDIVVFLTPEGEEISNDPRWHAKKLAEAESDGVEDEDGTPYDDWKGAQFKAEIERRNAGRDEGQQITVEGNKKSTYIAALVADDEAHPAA